MVAWPRNAANRCRSRSARFLFPAAGIEPKALPRIWHDRQPAPQQQPPCRTVPRRSSRSSSAAPDGDHWLHDRTALISQARIPPVFDVWAALGTPEFVRIVGLSLTV